MAKDRNGLYIQPDYWLAVEHLPKGQQDKALGAMVRLFFTGDDMPPSSGGARSAYFGVRERIIGARNKSKKSDEEEIENRTGNGRQTDGKRTGNSDFASKEGEGESIYLSGGSESLAEREQPTRTSQVDTAVDSMISDAIRIFTEETGRSCLMPPPIVTGYLERIFANGFTLDDIRQVCRHQNALWRGDKQNSAWIRPKTLFEPGKFEGYLNDARNNPEVKIDEEAAEFAGAF